MTNLILEIKKDRISKSKASSSVRSSYEANK